jgi:hypothetical protein
VVGDDGAEGRGEPGVGIDAVELAGFDQRGDDGLVFGTCVMAGKERSSGSAPEHPKLIFCRLPRPLCGHRSMGSGLAAEARSFCHR